MSKAAIYVRVSTTDKQDTDRQIKDLTPHVEKDGFKEPPDIFSEKISGYKKKEERYELERLIAQANKYSCIYVTEISRLGRNPKHTRELIDYLTDIKVPVYIQNIGQKTILEDGSRNYILSIVLQVLMEFADQEAKQMKQRSKSGLRTSAEKGKAGGSINFPYGYKKDDKKMLVIDENESDVVKKIFELYLSGLGTKKIANYLNDENIPTKFNNTYLKPFKIKNTPVKKDPKLVKWTDAVVYGILTNPIYKGDRRFKNEIFKAPAIIISSIWDKAKSIRVARGRDKQKDSKYLYILKDLLKCGQCSRNYYAKYRVSGKDKFYICSSCLIKGGNCGNKGIGIEILDGLVWHYVAQNYFLFIQDDYSNSNNINQRIKYTTREIKSIQNKISDQIQMMKRVKNLYVKGISTESEFLKDNKKIEDDLKLLESDLTSFEKELLVLQTQKKEIGNLKTFSDKLSKVDRVEINYIIRKIINKINITHIKNDFFFITFDTNYSAESSIIFNKKTKSFRKLDKNIFNLQYIDDRFLKHPIYDEWIIHKTTEEDNPLDWESFKRIQFDMSDKKLNLI
jgi:site-specific DNA recombinase